MIDTTKLLCPQFSEQPEDKNVCHKRRNFFVQSIKAGTAFSLCGLMEFASKLEAEELDDGFREKWTSPKLGSSVPEVKTPGHTSDKSVIEQQKGSLRDHIRKQLGLEPCIPPKLDPVVANNLDKIIKRIPSRFSGIIPGCSVYHPPSDLEILAYVFDWVESVLEQETGMKYQLKGKTCGFPITRYSYQNNGEFELELSHDDKLKILSLFRKIRLQE